MLYLLTFVVGLSIGSFVNVLLYRLPRQESFAKTRSKCPHCSYQLQWFDLVPLASFIFLSGKCRKCKESISPSYPAVELLFGLLSLLIFLEFTGNLLIVLFWLIIVSALAVLMLFDFRYLILPDLVLVSILVVTVVYEVAYRALGWSWFGVTWQSSIMAAMVIAIVFGAVWFFSRGKWLGFGDVKLGFIVGLIFGVSGSAFILYASFIIGGAIALMLLLSHKATLKTKLPLGSFISMASILYVFYQIPISHFLNKIFL